jgi:hypothetical protein
MNVCCRSIPSDLCARTTRRSVLSIGLVSMLLLTGCIQKIWERDEDAATRLQNAPMVMLDQDDPFHMVVMQAPSPGWSLRLDATERTPAGKRVFVTIRRPDPAYVYPQQIVLMRALTRVRLDSEIEVVGRLLDSDERTKGKGYAPLPLVESFE